MTSRTPPGESGVHAPRPPGVHADHSPEIRERYYPMNAFPGGSA
ncbi:hypothetical protein YT1_5332 [Rhodococcus ruber]|nr:hypothetical protein YT1_5332 [Rhodococcus ruber]